MSPVAGHAGVVAVVVPIRGFRDGGRRLASALDADARADLARDLAGRVLAAAAPLPVVVVTSDLDVTRWAEERGVTVVADPGRGLDAAVAGGRAAVAAAGFRRVVVAHADLPRARPGDLAAVATLGLDEVTVVPCHREDGTPVLALPTSGPFGFAYGPGSARRHIAAGPAAGWPVRVLRHPRLRVDVDVPEDLRLLADPVGSTR